MADCSNGPVNTLPGSVSMPPKGQCCDEHPGVPAYKRVTGEVDSFGAEYIDMCTTCYEEYRSEIQNLDTSGVCEVCNVFVESRTKRRDPDEGSSGRVYDVCASCSAVFNHIDEGDENDSRW